MRTIIEQINLIDGIDPKLINTRFADGRTPQDFLLYAKGFLLSKLYLERKVLKIIRHKNLAESGSNILTCFVQGEDGVEVPVTIEEDYVDDFLSDDAIPDDTLSPVFAEKETSPEDSREILESLSQETELHVYWDTSSDCYDIKFVEKNGVFYAVDTHAFYSSRHESTDEKKNKLHQEYVRLIRSNSFEL